MQAVLNGHTGKLHEIEIFNICHAQPMRTNY